ncbi:DUF4300 family protein [Romboutsia sp.]|uniref:DUF4300 family protein n=1 Tax=Romboutsia sp. TaxID=1965302 RepID=UPI003F3E51D2
MKKPIKIIITTVAGLLLVAGVSLVRVSLTDITYSNLATEKALTATADNLEEAGLDKKNIDIFKKQVKYTNSYLSELPSLQGDFITKNGTFAKHDEYLSFNLFAKASREQGLREDVNCRVSAWNLMKDNITVNGDNGQIEYTEKDILEHNPNAGFEKGDKEQFWGVFNGIPAGMINTTRGYSKTIKSEWENRNLEIKDSDRKLVSCFMYNFQEKQLEAVHAGTMIEQDGKIIFVEKISPTDPFQVSEFKNEKELEYYLKKMMLFNWFVVQPVIMVNDELM